MLQYLQNAINFIIDWADDHDGFIGLLSLIFGLSGVLVAWLLGLFRWLREKINPKPNIMVARIVGAAYPQKVTLEFENLSNTKILLHAVNLSVNTGDRFQLKEGTPIVLTQERKQLQFISSLSGSNIGHTLLTLSVCFGFVNKKKYTKSIAWSIKDGSVDVISKHALP